MNWKVKNLGDIVIDYHQGLNTAGEKIIFVDKGYPIIQTRNLKNGFIDISIKMKYVNEADWMRYKEKYKPSIGDVFLTNIGTIGKTAVVQSDREYLIHWNIFIFKLDQSNLSPYYLKYFLDTPFSENYYKSFQKGGTVNFITKKMIANLQIPVPLLSEQQAIVEKLDFAFDAIEKAKANIEKNIENAKELFQSKLNAIFSLKGVGWEEKTLEEIILKTKNINPREFPDKEFKYIDVSAVNRNTFLIAEYQTINSTNAPSRARKLVLQNDIIYATVRPTLTRVCIIEKEFDKQICSTGYVVLRHNEKIILPKIIFYFLLTSGFYDAMEKLQKGASYPAVTDNEIKMQIINFPTSKKEQEKIITQLDLLSDQTNLLQEKYKQKLANLEELKKSILEKAFKGELV